jgi:hypothetical protein
MEPVKGARREIAPAFYDLSALKQEDLEFFIILARV